MSGSSLLALSLLVSGRVPSVRAADPPQYYAIAFGLTSDVRSMEGLNESGMAGAVMKDGSIARIEGSAVAFRTGASGSVNAIDGNGTLVGVAGNDAIRIDADSVTILPGLGEPVQEANDINDAGTIVVGSGGTGTGESRGWIQDGAGTRELPSLGGDETKALKVNDAGLIAGTSETPSGETHLVTWLDGVLTDAGSLGGAVTGVIALTGAGSVVASMQLPTGEDRAGVWDGSTLVDIGTLGGSLTTPLDMNEAGVVVGTSQDSSGTWHAVRWDGTSLEDLGTLGGSGASAAGINALGQVTGDSVTAAGKTHGFLIDDGVMYDINDLLPPLSVEITNAGTITDSGYILANSPSGPVLLVPGPRPAAAYEVIDVAGSLGLQGANGVDLNNLHQVIGAAERSAFRFDGTTSTLLFGDQRSSAVGINDLGHVVGTTSTTGAPKGYLSEAFTRLLTLGGPTSDARDVNESDDAVGRSDLYPSGSHAFLYHAGVTTDLGALTGETSEALRVNELGQVIGTYRTSFGPNRGFFFDGTTATDLGTLGGMTTNPVAINRRGEVVGTSMQGNNATVAFRWVNGTMTKVGPATSQASSAVDINDAGVILGETGGSDQGFIDDHGVVTLIPTFGGTFSNAADINELGQVVGVSQDSHGVYRPYLFQDGQLTDLSTKLPLGYEATFSDVRKIADDGTILANGSTGDHSVVALLVPTSPLAPPTGPVRATVTSPNGGPVTVYEAPATDLPPSGSGYTFLGHQLNISAPPASTANPITLEFTIDQALLQSVDPDLTAPTVAVFRNGSLVGPCSASTTDDPATPDPCVSLRETVVGGADAGAARITVLTRVASHWNFGVVPPPSPPGAPTNVIATKGDKQATVSWTAPTSDGRSPLTGYNVTSTPGSKTATVGGGTTTATVAGLTNGTSYTFTVKAVNLIGTGPASTPSNAVTPAVPLSQTITFAKPANQTLPAAPLTVSATASSGLTVILASTTTGVCTVSNFTISFLAAGSCTITANQPGSPDYKPAAVVTRSFTVSQASQTIAFAKPADQVITTPSISVSATATSGLTVTITSTTTSICAINGFDVTLLATGTCSLTATQSGDQNVKSAQAVTRTFVISKASQTITFAKPANHTLLETPFTVEAAASSGLSVTLASTTTGVCTVNGFDITLLAAGSCSITASQLGDQRYKAAPVVVRAFTVSKASQAITVPDPGPQSMTVPTVVLTPFASSGLPVTLASQTTTICTLSGDTITLKKAGTCKVKGTQAGNAIYAAAPAVTISITVSTTGSLAYVVASGDELRIGSPSGQLFRFLGASVYGTSNPGAPTSPSSTVAMAVSGGLNTLRLVNMFDERGLDANAPFLEADWHRVDGLIARARGSGLRVVLDLSAFRNHLVNRDIRANGWVSNCQPGADRSPVDYGAIDPYRASLTAQWNAFLDFVANRVNTVNGVRYKDDPTIAVISIAGEPQPPASEECGKAVSTADLTDFYARTLGYLGSIDSHHLRSTGGLIHTDWQFLYGGSSGIDGEAIYALPDNTLPAVHTYPPAYAANGFPIDYQTPIVAAVANDLDKPWFTEEFGWTQSVGDATRASYFDWLYDEGDQYGSDGSLFWNLGPEQAAGSHDVNPSTSQTWAAVQAR